MFRTAWKTKACRLTEDAIMEALLMMAVAIIAGFMIVVALALIWVAIMLIKFIREELDI